MTTTSGVQWNAKTRYISPHLIDFGTDFTSFKESAAMGCEQFAPVLPIYHYDNLDEAIEYISNQCNSGYKPLTCHIFSTNYSNQRRLELETQSGMFCVNDAVLYAGNTHLPFGGVGNSGMGSYHGKFGFNAFSHLKTVLVKYNILDVPQRYPPYSGKSLLLEIADVLTPGNSGRPYSY